MRIIFFLVFFIIHSKKQKRGDDLSSEPIIGFYNSLGFPVTLPPSQAIVASKSLEKIESNIFKQDFSEFTTNLQKRKGEIDIIFEKNQEDLEKIKNALETEYAKGKFESDLKKWLKIKQEEQKILNDEKKLITDLLLIITKIEAAKYFAQFQQISKLESSLPFYDEMDKKFLKNIENSFQNPRSQIEKTSDNENYINLDEKIKLNEKKENIKKTPTFNDVFSSISYIQKMVSLDDKNIAKLITDAKLLVNKEIGLKEELLKNHDNLKEIESMLSKRNLLHQVPSKFEFNVDKLKEDLEDSKKRLWTLKQIEWVITQIETAKYFARLKQESPDNEEFQQKINRIAQ